MSKENPQAKQVANRTGCGSYSPGHQVHWIQARVKADKPRFDAHIEVLTPTKVRVSWLDQDFVFRHHNTARIAQVLKAKVLDYVKFAPDANLLYIQTEEPCEIHNGAFSLFYLSSSGLKPCTIGDTSVDTSTLVIGVEHDE